MKPLPTAKRPGWRWYVAYARLQSARVLALPTPQLLTLLLACYASGAFAKWMLTPEKTVVVDGVVQQKAWVQVVWAIAMLIVSALISYALRPKPKTPDPQTADMPTTEEGTSVVRIYGPVWRDPVLTARFRHTPIPIRFSAGKKG